MRTMAQLWQDYKNGEIENALRFTDDELGEARGIIRYFVKDDVKCGVLGLSGGIDSAVVAYLAVEALGAENVYGMLLPSATNTPEDLAYAKNVANKLGMEYEIIDIEPVLRAYLRTNPYVNRDRLAKGNTKARIRMTHLNACSNANSEKGMRVLGTDNKTESMMGYFTKHGDGGVDLNPIGDLYKTQVRQLARELGVPKGIIKRAPTAGLWKGQTDEGEMGITYDELDKVLLGIELGCNKPFINEVTGVDMEKIRMVFERHRNSQHKREMPKFPKIFRD